MRETRKRKQILFQCLALCFCLWSLQINAQVDGIQYDWKPSVNKEGIRVFKSKVPGSAYHAVKAKMEIDGDINSLVAMLEDTENCSNWASLCKEVSLLKTVSNQEYIVYILNAVTFPVSDRDLIAHITWSEDSQTGRLTMNSQAVSPYLGVPKKRGVVRIENAITQWHFTAQTQGKVLVESYAHIDPNGPIPAWIVNMLSKNAPYRSMKKVRDIIQAGVYLNANTNLFKTEK